MCPVHTLSTERLPIYEVLRNGCHAIYEHIIDCAVLLAKVTQRVYFIPSLYRFKNDFHHALISVDPCWVVMHSQHEPQKNICAMDESSFDTSLYQCSIYKKIYTLYKHCLDRSYKEIPEIFIFITEIKDI